MKKLISLFLVLMILSSCADDKVLCINGEQKVVEPYGWGNIHEKKVEGVVYDLSVGNVVWSVILCETIIVPIWLTGWELYEPVKSIEECETKQQ